MSGAAAAFVVVAPVADVVVAVVPVVDGSAVGRDAVVGAIAVVPGISGMSNLKKVGRIGVKSLIYFEVITTISLAIGILLADLLKPGKIDKRGLPIQDASTYTQKGAAHIDWGKFFLDNLTLQVLVLAIIVGIIVSLSRHREKVLVFLDPITQWVLWLLKIVMLLAPLGAFGGMASTIGKYGIRTLIPLAKLMITMYSTMAVFIIVVLGSILRYFKLNVFTYLKNIKEEILIVLGTSSSEAALSFSAMEKKQGAVG